MDSPWRRVGLIVNPTAGKGPQEALTAARKAVESLCIEEVLTGEGELGQAAFTNWTGRLQSRSTPGTAGRDRTRAIANWIAAQGADALIVIGGDGTVSDVAQVCIETGLLVPIVGVGAGSTNAGRLITCRADRAGELRAEDMETWSADCLVASRNGQMLGLAFNDVVIGYTVVAIVGGKRLDVDAAERMHGRTVEGRPRTIGNRRTRVTKSFPGGAVPVAEGESVGAVVAGFAERAFFGKAITGQVCLTALAGLPAGCLVCETPLARVGVTKQEVFEAPPVLSKYVSLSEEAAILVENVNPGAALCADGNPLCSLTTTDRAEIAVRSGAVVGVRSSKDLRSA